MKIAHVFIRMPVGGAEDLVGDILRTAPANVDIRVVCLQELGKVGAALQEQFPGKVELLPWVPNKRFRIGAVFKLAQWLKQEGIQLVHTHVYNAHVYGVLAARRAGIPCVLHHHKTYAEMRWRRKIVLRALSHRAAAHITLSAQTREDLCRVFGIPPEKVRVFINPVDDDTFHPSADRPKLRQSLGLEAAQPLVGTVASLTPPKNHLLNVAMTARLNELGFTGRFLAFGEGGERSRIAEAAQQKQLTNFELMGARRPIAPWMQALDVFTLGSTWEGQPMVLLQALACGLPIVASNIEGNAAVLGSDHPALFDVSDEKAYANMVWRVLNDQAFRTSILEHQKRRKSELPMLRDYSRELATFYEGILASTRH
jgi:glycosyltransferase involved in cell wall biosynthesis